MKKFFKTMATLICLFNIILFSACEDKTAQTEEQLNDYSMFLKSNAIGSNLASATRCFASYDELFTELETVKSLNIDQLIAYENSIGVRSFGRASEEIYYSIVGHLTTTSAGNSLDSVTMRNAVLSHINQNPNFLELTQIDGEYYFNPKLNHNPWRYVVGVNQICKIADSVLYKVFDKGTVYASIENYAALVSLTEADLDLIENSTVFTYFPCQQQTSIVSVPIGLSDWSVYNEKFSSDKKDKLEVSVGMSLVFIYMGPYAGKYKGGATLVVQPKHKTLGIYFISKRTITTNITVNIRICASNITVTDQYTGSHPEWKRNVTLVDGYYNCPNGKFIGTSGYARIAEVTVPFNF